MTRRHHGLGTHILFIDLIKAFDSVNYEIMYKIIARYGIPEPLINVIKKMYSNCTVQVSAGNEREEVEYGAGVQQGDNMAPPLFLLVMQAAIETLETNSTSTKLEFRHHPLANNPDKQKGRLQGQAMKWKGETLLVNNLLYVDDGAFAFPTRQSLEEGAQQIYDHLTKFGLEMHIGTEKAKSKTEAMYVPPSLEEAQASNEVPENIPLNQGKNNVHYMRTFKYLGSIIATDLTEDTEIEIQIKKAWSQMGMLRHLFKSRDVDRRVKYLIYLAAPINTLLWGSESWNFSRINRNKLAIFHHSAIRYILNIRWDQIREQRISNREVRRRFENIPDIDFFITK